MDTRERFVKTLTGEKVDRVPFIKVFGGTNAAHEKWEAEYPGIRQCIDKVLGFEGVYRGWQVTPVNMDASRMDEPVTIKETDEIRVARLGDGVISQLYKKGDYAHHEIDWPVKTKSDCALDGRSRYVNSDPCLVA